MYIDKIIKREVISLLFSVLFLIIIIIGVSYAAFFSIDEGEDNIISIGNLDIKYCNDTSCKSTYSNIGQIIGTTTKDGITSPSIIFPYSDEDALKQIPYIFNIKNIGTLDSYLTIRLVEDKDFKPLGDYETYNSLTDLYSNHLKVGIKNCTNSSNYQLGDINIYSYGNLNDNIILEKELLENNSDKTYCLWVWLDNKVPNEVQESYFVANVDVFAEYLPKSPLDE